MTKTPFYFPLAGFSVGNGLVARGTLGGTNGDSSGAGQGENTIAQAHFIIYPVWGILEMFTDLVCVENSGLDYAYITEVDPLWQDSELALLIQPEALLFANPIATILAAKMMLTWLGETEKADKIERAVAAVIQEGKVRTYDMGGDSKTLEMAKAIAAKL